MTPIKSKIEKCKTIIKITQADEQIFQIGNKTIGVDNGSIVLHDVEFPHSFNKFVAEIVMQEIRDRSEDLKVTLNVKSHNAITYYKLRLNKLQEEELIMERAMKEEADATAVFGKIKRF